MPGEDIGPEFARNLRAALAQGKEGGKKALGTIGIEGVNRVRSLLSTPGTGRTYVRRGGVVHRASAPGHPPAPDEGHLRASYAYALGSMAGRDFVAIGSPLKKAPMLEMGTSKMAARPHLRPGILTLQGIIGKIIADGWSAGTRR